MIYYTTIDLSPGGVGTDTTATLPRIQDIRMARGSDFIWQITVQPPDEGLGWTSTDEVTSAAFKWRQSIGSSTVVLEGSTAGNYLTVDDSDPANVIITVDVPASITKDIVSAGSGTILGTSTEITGFREGGSCVHDLEVTLDNTRVFRVVQGNVILSDEVTR